ncbi:uncharacterized protein MONOS_10187fu12137fu12138 [Monocercomonoides exilis]|uniref:uncharacterized protein n=1 Tax=Monocercomonoides exilis TaxID=2049356 RepID=UPI00355A1549|nr:hypothetical protein MONOS_10187fu12137fu12138 [Monocercomonoides exilis]
MKISVILLVRFIIACIISRSELSTSTEDGFRHQTKEDSTFIRAPFSEIEKLSLTQHLTLSRRKQMSNDQDIQKLSNEEKMNFHMVECSVVSSVKEINASLKIEKLNFISTEKAHTAIVESSSFLELRTVKTILVSNEYKNIFICNESRLYFNNISVITFDASGLRESLVTFTSSKDTIHHSSKSTVLEIKKNCSLSVENSVFSSFLHLSGNPFLASSGADRVMVNRCIFQNISSEGKKMHCSQQELQPSHTFLFNSMFTKVDIPFYGGIVLTLCNEHSLTADNCSFLSAQNTKNLSQKISKNGSSNCFIHYCLFKDLRSGTSGAAVQYSGSGIFNVTDCDAVNCLGNHCGAFGSWGSAESHLLRCTATNCSANAFGGGTLMNGGTISNIQDNNYTNCATETTNGGGLHHRTGPPSPNDVIIRCYCFNCTNKGGGGNAGGGGMWIGETNGTKIIECCCCQCLATKSIGGGIGLSYPASGEKGEQSPILSFCFFKNNSGINGGNDVSVGREWKSTITKDCFTQCYSSSELNHVIIFDGIAQNEWIPFAAFPNIHINQSGTDNDLCGNLTIPCETIVYSLNKWNRWENQLFILSPNSFSAQNIQVEGKTYEFEGNLNTLNMQNTVFESTTQSGGSLFEIHSDKLRVRRIVFKIPHPPFSPTLFRTNTDGDAILDIQNITVMQQSSSLENSVFILLSGIVICESVVIDTLTTQDHSIIKMESSCVSLSANDSVFKNTNCKKGNGSIINSVVGNSSQILLTGCNFSNCSCSGGSGGCCFFRMMLGGQVTLGLHDMEISSCNAEGTENDQGFGGGVFMDIRDGVCDFKFYEMKFQSCTATKGGNSVFVEAKKMRDALIKERIDFNYCGMSDKDLEGFEDGYYGEAIPLIPYLLTFSSPAYVGGTKSRDFTACGFNNYPCSTIEMAVRLRFPSSKRCDKKSTINLLPFEELKCSALITSKIDCQLTNIIFSVPLTKSENVNCMISVEAGTFLMSYCGLKMRNEQESLNCCVFTVTSGSMKMHEFEASSIRIEGNPLISLEGNDTRYEADRMLLTNVSTTSCNGIIEVSDKASLRIKNSIFTSPLEAVNSCVLFCESSSSIELVNNTLSNISRSDCNGGAICVSIIDRSVLCIDECTFSFCASNRGNGGGICVNLLGDSSLEIGNSSSNKNNGQMINCEASEDNQEAFGLGGGIYLDIKEGSGQFSFDKLLFDSCNARHGSNVFVSAQNLSEKINNMTLKFQLTTLGFHSVEGFENATTGDIFAIPLLVFLWNNFSFPVHVGGSSSGDFSKCGHYEVPCSTIEHAVLLRCGEESRDIELHHPFSLDHELKLDRYPWKISISDEEKRICVMCNEEVRQQGIIETSVKTTMKNLHFQVSSTLENYTSLILCVKSSLSLIDCRILCSERETNVHSSFLIVQSGISSLENFVIDGINFDGASGFIIENEGTFLMNSSSIQEYASTEKGIIEFSFGKEIIIEGCNFSFVETRKGDGSVIKCSVGDEASAIFYSINASSCETDEGNGGVIAAELQEGSTFACGRIDTTTNIQKCASREKNLIGGNGGGIWISINSETCTVKMTSIEFGVGEEGNIATNNGENIFLLGEDLTKLSIDQWIKLNISTNPEDHSKYIGKDRSRMQIVPIVSFMHEWCKPAFVGGTEEFYYPTCGFYFYPCSSIQYAVSTKFGNERADLTLLKQFKFKDCTNFDSKPVYINGENEGLEIEVMGTIEGTGNGLLEINIPVTVSEIGFSLPSRFNKPSINTIFLCETSTLVLENSFVSAKDENVMYCFIKVMGGILTIRKFEIGPIVFKSSSVIVFEGAESNGNMTEMDFKEVQIIEGNSLIWMRNGIVNLTNCTMQKTIQQDNNGVRIEEGCSVEMENSTFSQMKRDRGNGGVVNCVVGNGKTVRIENCTFSNGSTGSGERGGGLFLNIKESSSFLFNRNDINWCFTPSESGYGGGIYVRFDVMLKNYSMKNLSFRENVAWRGKDIFVVCAAPRIVINPLLWNGTSSETEDEDARRRLWVVDDEPALLIDRSLFYYLYPTTDEILFVDKSGSAEMNCGFEDTPCINVELGLKKMNEEKLTIQIQKEAELNGIINRNGSSLTIRGNQTKVRMEIGQNGHLELTNGTLNTGLTLSKLQVGVPENSKESELLAVCIGLASITNCEFLILARSYSSTNVQIASVKGGELHMTDTLIQGISFTAKKGVFFVENANMQIELTSFRNITSESDSLIAGYVESIITLKMVDLDECKLLKGSICSVGKGNIEITNSSSFSGFEKTSRDGGMLRFEGKGQNKMILKNTSVENFKLDGENCKGGGAFLILDDDYNNCFQFSNVTFTNNSASFGGDLFVTCNDLNSTIISERFLLELFDEFGSQIINMVGMDKANYSESPVDLYMLLVKRVSDCVYVSQINGIDVQGCGELLTPCSTIWSGIDHLSDSVTEENPKVVLLDFGIVKECYDLQKKISIIGEKEDEDSICEISVNDTLPTEARESIINTKQRFEMERLMINIPSMLASNPTFLLQSTDNFIGLAKCSFACHAKVCIKYGLVRKINGEIEMKMCNISCLCFESTPFVFSSSVILNECHFDEVESPTCQDGGVLHINLSQSQTATLNKTYFTNCQCSSIFGKGGAAFILCNESEFSLPFYFNSSFFDSNCAFIGMNAFILSFDLNTSVTSNSFAFDWNSFKGENNLFVGSDKVHEEVDLFLFLDKFQNECIRISSGGYDVMRCGDDNFPCRSFWKGYYQLIESTNQKKIVIEGETKVENSFDLRNITIESSDAFSKTEKIGKLSFGFLQEGIESYLLNYGSLNFVLIKFEISQEVDSVASSLITNKNGELVVESCSLGCFIEFYTIFYCSFCCIYGGYANICDFTAESMNVGKGLIIVDSSSLGCLIDSTRLLSLNVSSSSLIEVRNSDEIDGIHKFNNIGTVKLGIGNCLISNVIEKDNEACVLGTNTPYGVELKMNGSVIEDAKAINSQEGGGVYFRLNSGGLFRMENSTITRSCCSDTGYGGGVYLESQLTDKLNFLFFKMIFSGNTGGFGRDVFVSCVNIANQVNESHFMFDLREDHFIRQNAIFGKDVTKYINVVDLLDFITIFQADTIIVSSFETNNGSDTRQCGSHSLPCLSIDYGINHLTNDYLSRMIVDTKSLINGEMSLEEMTLSSKTKNQAEVQIVPITLCDKENIIRTINSVSIEYIKFIICDSLTAGHNSLISPENGKVELFCCSFVGKGNEPKSNIIFPFPVILLKTGDCIMNNCSIENLEFKYQLLMADSETSLIMNACCIQNVTSEQSPIESYLALVTLFSTRISNVLVKNNSINSIISVSTSPRFIVENCSLTNDSVLFLITARNCMDTKIESGLFEGNLFSKSEEEKLYQNSKIKELCQWNESIVELINSTEKMKDTIIKNSEKGGVSIEEGDVWISKCEFINNGAGAEKYPSARKNIACSENGVLLIESLKGGDGAKENSSLWIANSGCSLQGIVDERISALFIPIVESVEIKADAWAGDKGEEREAIIRGQVLMPCNLWMRVEKWNGADDAAIWHEVIEESGYVSEREVQGRVRWQDLGGGDDLAEVRIGIEFGEIEESGARQHTECFVVKNRSEQKSFGDEKITEGAQSPNASWSVIVCIAVVVILLITLIIFIVRWRKQKRRTEELEVIVEDTVKKDPKSFEMVTMEMSPEEQWRRAEREAEKKSEERIKKRVYERNMEHSESSEHLLSESGSTEYILGRDSDKIPEWVLEKVDEKEIEEETRKRTPSPSISSTSTTDTSDTESTFVRSESLCPTTSSMSNLVDAMACSSVFEKLIVDLRDSLFMLLHGRNEKKEMAIGTLKEREQTAAQILFWVANLALHSFDEMNNPLSSLANLSPHIVLFSEHMVICIALHSDCSSGSDTSSTFSSTSTIVTSSSDCSAINKKGQGSPPPPSSAFEDEDDNRKECLRWKAPELLMNKDLGSTKKTVVFSIGMMLWESLTLEIPFGEYEAEVAGMWLKEGKRPKTGGLEGSRLEGLVKGCFSQEARDRCTLTDVKRVLIGLFPAGTVMLTVTDAIGLEEGSGSYRKYSRFSGEGSN